MIKFGTQNMYSELKSVLMKRPQSFMSKVNSNKWNYDFPLDQNLINKNYNEFKKIIENFGTEIFELKLEDDNMELCDSIFTHDPSLIIDEGAIILNMGKKLRKPETKAHYNFYKSLDIPIIGVLNDDATVEGGDCLWINKKLLLIGKSNRTNIEGIKQLKELLKRFDIEINVIKLPEFSNQYSCFHLMSALSILDKDLIIGYKKYLDSEFFKILNKNKIKFINIPEEDYFKSKTLAVNILTLSPRNLILMREFPKTCELLIKEKCNLNLFSGSELCIKAEGGPTCLTRPIFRK